MMEPWSDVRAAILAKQEARKVAAKRAAAQRVRQASSARYYAKLARERATIQQLGASPYDRAVKRIVRLTGVPASEWEHDSRHRYTQLAVRVAQELAGIDPTRQPARAA